MIKIVQDVKVLYLKKVKIFLLRLFLVLMLIKSQILTLTFQVIINLLFMLRLKDYLVKSMLSELELFQLLQKKQLLVMFLVEVKKLIEITQEPLMNF